MCCCVLAVEPGVACALSDHDVRVGEEVGMACTVDVAPVQGGMHKVTDLIFTNIISNGTERNITATQEPSGFKYRQVVGI